MPHAPTRPPRAARPAPAALRGAMQTESGASAPLLYLEQLPNLTHGLTPGRLRRILADAEQGDTMEQHALFADMEDRCEHLACEIGKRKRALLTLEWDIIPGSEDARARELARRTRELVDMLPNVEDMILDMADAIGHGFAALELEWGHVDGRHVPRALTFRPQSWFRCLWTDRNELRLRDGSAEGAALWPCGWIVHTHKSKSGWLPRAGLFRTVAWAYLIRAYALNAAIAYTQIHGLPLRLGKYPPGATREDKSALLHALRCLGQDAAGIIPTGMEVLFQTPAASPQDIPGQLVTRCEQGMSKAILGGTLTTQADGKTSTHALGSIHNEVRHDLLAADAEEDDYTDDDFGDGEQKYPLFWVKYSDAAPYLSKQVVMTSNLNNAATMSMDDYFTRNMYKGKIYKTANLLGRTLAQYCPDDSTLAKEQRRIEAELAAFEKNVWGDQARKDSLDSIAKAEAKTVKGRKAKRNRRASQSVSRKSSKSRPAQSSGSAARVTVRRQRH